MPDIFHTLSIKASPPKVFEAISTAQGLSSWWTKESTGNPGLNEQYSLFFAPEYDWLANVSLYKENHVFELQLTKAMDDWLDTRVGFILKEADGLTKLSFYHMGWHEQSEHFCISSYCWAMYLRHLKRYVELGVFVPYDQRDST